MDRSKHLQDICGRILFVNIVVTREWGRWLADEGCEKKYGAEDIVCGLEWPKLVYKVEFDSHVWCEDVVQWSIKLRRNSRYEHLDLLTLHCFRGGEVTLLLCAQLQWTFEILTYFCKSVIFWRIWWTDLSSSEAKFWYVVLRCNIVFENDWRMFLGVNSTAVKGNMKSSQFCVQLYFV